MRRLGAFVLFAALLSTGLGVHAATASDADPGPQTTTAAQHDISAPLRRLAQQAQSTSPAPKSQARLLSPRKANPSDRQQAIANSNPSPPDFPDPTGPAPGQAVPEQATGFDGISNASLGNLYYPPDTNGDIGPDDYVQIVNAALAVYDRSGNVQLGPVNNNTIWSGFGGPCETYNDGDPIVQYDQFSDRWLISQFAISGAPPYYQCVAVSTTGDPTGSYNRYAFAYTDLPDYPKFGVWPDAYYVSYNMYSYDSQTKVYSFTEAKLCAFDRAAMIAGQAATQQCFGKAQKAGLATEFSLLPSDTDGSTAPPPGAPNYFLGESWDKQNRLTMYRFAVDWGNPANSTLAGPISIAVNDFTWACTTAPACVPQPDTSQKLDSLGGRAMYRLAYRNFGSHQSLLMNHSVSMDGQLGLTSQTGVGWYEIRQPDAVSPVVYQQGTTADPDGSTFRYMGSMAMDRFGNIALGYSKAGSKAYPGIAYTGRLASDPLNQMTEIETPVMVGSGSQLGTRGRWGDYSAMQVDPNDDCTFWYTNEYMAGTSWNSWRTRVAHFSFPACTARPNRPVSVTATPGPGRAEVSWSAPDDNGWPVESYEVSSTPASAGCVTSSTSCTISGLTPGATYEFTVTATNTNGTGPGGTSPPMTVPAPPGAPEALAAAAGNGLVRLSWGAAQPNGAPVTDYTVTSTPGSIGCTTSSTSCTVGGLTNGTTYTFTVTARNEIGTGPAAVGSATPLFAGPLSVSAAKVVKPGAAVPVAVAGSSPGCSVSVSLDSRLAQAQVGSDGTASVSVKAPKPNGKYQIQVVQGGASCVPAAVSRMVRVTGVYATGNTNVATGKTATYKAHELIAKAEVVWKVKRNGTVLVKKSKKATSSRSSKFTYTFPKKGTYKILALQANGRVKAKRTVDVG